MFVARRARSSHRTDAIPSRLSWKTTDFSKLEQHFVSFYCDRFAAADETIVADEGSVVWSALQSGFESHAVSKDNRHNTKAAA